MSREIEFSVGDQFVCKKESSVATVSERRIICGIQHYKISLQPNTYGYESEWISGHGILLDFEPKRGEAGDDRAFGRADQAG